MYFSQQPICGFLFACVMAHASLAFPASKDLRFDDEPPSVYDLPEPVAIQNRKYSMGTSLNLGIGYLPTDSFNKGYTFSGAYRWSLTHYLVWEVLSFTHVLNRETQLRQDLLALGVDVRNVGLGGVLDYPRQIYMTGIHYSPMYSKSLLFNSRLTFSETSLFFGVGSLNFNRVGHKPMIAPGVNTRIYLSPGTAITAYFRDHFFNDDNTGITGIIEFGVGFEIKLSNLGGGVEYKEKGSIKRGDSE